MFAIIILFIALNSVQSAKILVVVPTPSISHQVVFRPLIQELVNRNHEVTVITTDPAYPQGGSPKNLTEIDLHELSYTFWSKWFEGIENFDRYDRLSKLKIAYRLISEVFEKQLQDNKVQEIITNQTLTFDLLILEEIQTPALIFSHIFKAPVIQMSSFGANPGTMEMIGANTHPYLYPMQFRDRLYNLTILEKVTELYNHVWTKRMVEQQEQKNNRMLQRVFGDNIPLLSELRNNIHMLFLNVHPIWLDNQPVPSNVVCTWGIHKTPVKQLPEDLQSFLDSSENGVIYISFGTNFHTSSMPSEALTAFLEVLTRLPYNVLWKWDTDELPGQSDNIKISRWFPQSDVLRHPNVKLFITQGGLQSTDEAITAGVPLIGMPMIGDQEYNTEKYVHFKIGIKLGFKSLTAERLDNAIKTIFKDHRTYKKNIIQLRTYMQDQPMPPLDNAIWWIEYTLRHGGASQLRTSSFNMPWTEYYELKLLFVMFVTLIILLTMSILIIYITLKCILQIIPLQSNKVKLS